MIAHTSSQKTVTATSTTVSPVKLPVFRSYTVRNRSTFSTW